MYSNVKIKICGFTRESDVELALSLGVDYFGFIVYPYSPRALNLERARNLASLVPPGKRVIVDVETGVEELERMYQADFDYFQIHTGRNTNVHILSSWSELVGKERLWLAPRLAVEEDFPVDYLKYAETFLIDTYHENKYGGTGKTSDWPLYSKLAATHFDNNWILAGGLSPSNVVDAIKCTSARHIDLNSGVEIKPGVKDEAKLSNLFKMLRLN